MCTASGRTMMVGLELSQWELASHHVRDAGHEAPGLRVCLLWPALPLLSPTFLPLGVGVFILCIVCCNHAVSGFDRDAPLRSWPCASRETLDFGTALGLLKHFASREMAVSLCGASRRNVWFFLNGNVAYGLMF